MNNSFKPIYTKDLLPLNYKVRICEYLNESNKCNNRKFRCTAAHTSDELRTLLCIPYYLDGECKYTDCEYYHINPADEEYYGLHLLSNNLSYGKSGLCPYERHFIICRLVDCKFKHHNPVLSPDNRTCN